MKKYFIVSDVHGCYEALVKGLEGAGYDSSNPAHVFVSLGDLFDRGDNSYECLQFVNSLPKDRKILILGNHEYELAEAIARKRFLSHDSHNKTDRTCWEFYKKVHPEASLDSVSEDEVLSWLETWEDLKEYQSCLKLYYIAGNNVFVHGWVPYRCKTLDDIIHAKPSEWYNAIWSDGVKHCIFYGMKIMSDDSSDAELVTVFCGHVHSFIHNNRFHCSGSIEHSSTDDIDLSKIDNTPFVDEGVVNVDSYTYITNKVNVSILEG